MKSVACESTINAWTVVPKDEACAQRNSDVSCEERSSLVCSLVAGLSQKGMVRWRPESRHESMREPRGAPEAARAEKSAR